ncbi:hypothetical protein [Candidatus Nitrospira allomarina]|uniref:Uncharacterized protein n=1 Tax=Candidatus Nitrospira allomarina TaxID=3020900 RepID=A0AA96JTV2_9BACT|nr:hypothetical protein [Candidatus Nitrospira allomarina]WNM59937.1 hypothetical protein PP769_09320 [Candidatus Nitrospira allomarina]
MDEWLKRFEQKTLSQSPGAEQETGNMVFFRGGCAGLVNDRSNEVDGVGNGALYVSPRLPSILGP